MAMTETEISSTLLDGLRRGLVIPAHPMALTASRALDERRQRALTRYYLDSGVGGIAIGVHTTQFEIHDPEVGLYEPVLSLAAEEIAAYSTRSGKEILNVAGVCGTTAQAVAEAGLCRDLGFHTALLNLSAMRDADLAGLLDHCRAVAEVMPVFGFYLQPAVGGCPLPYVFWRGFFDIDNVLAVKIAPFNRYQTFDVIRALAEAGRQDDVVLYTGNDDNIVLDLVTPYEISTGTGPKTVRIVGGLLGHWAVWTRRAVEQLYALHDLIDNGAVVSPETLVLANQITDSNAALFDAANGFFGCIPGIHEVLRRQGLLEGIWCLDSDAALGPGQAEELDRVTRAYPHLTDDEFVAEHIDDWLK